MSRPLLRSILVTASVIGALCATAQFADDFTDLDFTTGVVWSGNDVLFTATTGQLQSQSPGAANYYLSTPSTQATNAQWEFFENLKFATSGSNYADVYLMSDAADLSGTVNGYFVRMGETTDHVALYRSDAGVNTLLLASPDGVVNSSTNNPFRIRVKRDASDNWTLEYDDGALGTYTSAGSTVDNTYNACTSFGVYIVQSSAAGPINNHFFDDISVGPIVLDLTPPTLLSATAISDTQVDLVFSEALDNSTVIATVNYDFLPVTGVFSAQPLPANTVRVTVTSPFQSGVPYTVTVNGVADLAGNPANNTSASFTWFVPDVPAYRSVVINEIMADPTPVIGLPEIEFAEIMNTTADQTYDLAGWKYTDGTTISTLPSYILGPGEYAIIVNDNDTGAFFFVDKVIPVSAFPSQNNDGDALVLSDADGNVIDHVTYALSWYRDGVKADGGWTLEQINPTTTCSGAANWIASNDSHGGTPGEQNSVYDLTPDTQAPSVIGAYTISSTEVELIFDEALDSTSVLSASYVIVPTLAIAQVNNVAPAYDRVRLTLSTAMAPSTVYTVTVSSVNDCPGNGIGTANTTIFALPEAVITGDVVINEVLYDPVTGGSDFVEVYNRSGKILSLAGWKLANETNGAIDNATVFTTEPSLFFPGDYVFIAEDVADILSRFPTHDAAKGIEANMPSYNNGFGTVVLQDSAGNTLDLFRYNDDLHFALLNSAEGVTLERIDPERPTSDNTNWHSAAETVGFGTPGLRNSQYAPAVTASGSLTIDPAIFSPDDDGYQDVLTLSYQFNEPGFTGTITVFDIAGREVKKLMENVLLGTTGSISWDGIMEGGDKARIGPYVVVFEAFDISGNVEKFRETVVLAHKLD